MITKMYLDLGTSMKISARNVLKGRVKRIVEGLVNSEVAVELPEGMEITYIITKRSVEKILI